MYTFDFGSDASDKNPYRLINQNLFSRNSLQLRKIRGLLYKLFYSLRSLPRSTHPVLYRGIKDHVKLDDTHYHKGNKITWHTFSSTTPDMETTQQFLTDPVTGRCEGTLFIIRGTPWGYHIKPFSCFPAESEILLEPEIDLKVAGIIKAPLIVVELEMLPDQKLLLESLIPPPGANVMVLLPPVSSQRQLTGPPRTCIAQDNWDSTLLGGLSFKQGDVINIIDDSIPLWWVGDMDGRYGWIPPGCMKMSD